MKLLGLTTIKDKIDQKTDKYFRLFKRRARTNYFTQVYGLGRTILALGTLLTLVFNDTSFLYAEFVYDLRSPNVFMDQINLFYLFDYESLYLAKLIAIFILLLVISGYLPRYTGVLHWWVAMSFYNSVTIVDGGDQIASVISFFLIPITLMDSRINHWNKANASSEYKNFAAFFGFLLIEIQVAVIYFQSGFEKPYKVAEWLDGTAVYYWFNHNLFGGPEWLMTLINPIMDSPFLISLLNWGVILFEITLFGILFMNKRRRIKFLKYAIMFHFMILLMHGLFSFFFSISAALILYLVPKEFDLTKLKKTFF